MWFPQWSDDLQTCVIQWLVIWFSLASRLATCRDGWFWMWDEMWPSLCTCLGINFKRSIRNSEIMFHPQKGVVKHSLPCEFATLRASIHEPFTGLNLRKVFRLNYMKDGIWGDFCQADLGPLNWEISPSTHRQLIFEKVKQEFHRSELRYNFLKLKVCHCVNPPKKKDPPFFLSLALKDVRWWSSLCTTP